MRLPIAVAALVSAVLAVQPTSAATPPANIGQAESLTLPNLAPLPPYDVYVGRSIQPEGAVWSNLALDDGPAAPPRALRFTTTIQNRGRYAFEMAGAPWLPDPQNPDIATSQAYQCVRFSGPQVDGAQRECVRYDSVGTLSWHAQHHHFHINGFGRYELRREKSGRADMAPTGLVGKSQKVGWCVSDMYRWRKQSEGVSTELAQTALRLAYGHSGGWYEECTDPILYSGASWRQGISPGWADTYPAMYVGQEIPLTGVQDGIYWIVTTINPRDNEHGLRVAETTWADNVAASRIQIYGGGAKARLLWPIPAEPYRGWLVNPSDQPGD